MKPKLKPNHDCNTENIDLIISPRY